MIFWLVKKKYTTGKQKRKTPRRFCVVKFMTLYDMIAFSMETLLRWNTTSHTFYAKKNCQLSCERKKVFFLKKHASCYNPISGGILYDKNLTARRLLNIIEFIRFQTFRLSDFIYFLFLNIFSAC